MRTAHSIPGFAALALLLHLVGGTPTPGLAQVDGPHLQLSVGYGAAWFEQWLGIEDGGAWSARLGYHPRAAWGVEAQLEHVSSGTRSTMGSGSSTFTFVSLGARYDFLPFETISPFASVSLGYARLSLPEELFGVPGLGLAAGVNWRVSEQISLYGELKDDLARFRGSLTQQLFLSVGLRFAFGRTVDGDGDGISDSRDQCPDTARGAVVDERGCPSDPDGDGVPDGLDACPATPTGTAVDERGCPLSREDPSAGG